MENHEQYQELLSSHALDALDASDRTALEQHLDSCLECARELAEMRDAAALLAHAAPTVSPAAELRGRILATVRTDAAPAPTSATVLPFTKTRSRTGSYLLRIAAVVALVAMAIGLFVMWRVNVNARREIARLIHDQRVLESRQKSEEAQMREALQLLASHDSTKMQLNGTQTAADARAMFVYDQKSRHAALIAEGLPTTPAAKAYQLWFIPKGHAPMPGKIFRVDSTGRAILLEHMPLEAMGSAVIAITLEPDKGSAQPTGAIYLSSPG